MYQTLSIHSGQLSGRGIRDRIMNLIKNKEKINKEKHEAGLGRDEPK